MPAFMSRKSRPPQSVLAVPVVISVLLVLATLAAYGGAGENGFVETHDDNEYVTHNPHVRAGLTADGVIWALTATAAANWHPLTWLSLMLDAQWNGANPRGYHWTNVILHAANAVLFFLVWWRMTGAVWRSALLAALFALHPLHVESVAWISERKDVLSTLFWVLAMAAYTGYVRQPGVGRYLLVVLLFALGLTAKPMLVTLPFVFLLLDYWPLRRIATEAEKSADSRAIGHPPDPIPRFSHASFAWLIVEKIPLLVLSLASAGVTLAVQSAGGAVMSVEKVPLEDRLGNALVAYGRYVGKALWPTDLAAFYPLVASGRPLWQLLAAGLTIAIITASVILMRRRYPYLLVGWLWYLGTLVPVIGLVQVGMQALADRYTYIPLLGLFVMVSWGLADLGDSWRIPVSVRAAGTALVLAGCLVLTRAQVRYWRDDLVLWKHALEVTKANSLAHLNYGLALDWQGRVGSAIAEYQQALQLRDPFPEARYNLARALARQGQWEEAVRNYELALPGNPNAAEIHSNLGVALAQQGKLEEACAHFALAVRLNPSLPSVYVNLGLTQERLGRPEAAAESYAAALALAPDLEVARANLDRLRSRRGG
jgi:tetratricopeptide (TPR) repeat protein